MQPGVPPQGEQGAPPLGQLGVPPQGEQHDPFGAPQQAANAGIPQQQTPYGVPEQQVISSPHMAPVGQQVMVGQVQSTNAMAALVLGILGIIGSLFYGIGCLFGMIGLFLTHGAKKITDANPMHPDKGTVTAALVTNWIAVGIGILMIVVVVGAGVIYVWANSLASDGTDTSASTLNTYTADDAADEASAAGESDILIKMQMTGRDDLAWSFVKVTLSVGDNVYSCSVAAGDDCVISQSAGSNDNAWEPGEYIFLSEGTQEICSNSGCMVDISVTHNGRTVAGDGSVQVN
jgi:hypothetical protein